MWLFEKRGFVSTVAYDPKKDLDPKSPFKAIAKSKDTHLLVRFRVKADADWLKASAPGMVVETDSSADYAYRAVISREEYKKALCDAVDAIDYDSHFKEAARDNSPKAEGRYSAMMGVWTAMSKLQDIAPWSGLRTRGYTSFSSGTSNTRWWDDDDLLPGLPSHNAETFRNGGGPKTGFKEGDRVVGYSGAGEVVSVTENGGKRADSVRVKFDSGKTLTITSNFLMAEPEDESSGEDLDRVYELCVKALVPGADTKPVTEFPSDQAAELSEDAFDLLVRVQGAIESGEHMGRDELDEVYDEILWEYSTDEERLDVFSDASSVPTKFEADAIKLFSSV